MGNVISVYKIDCKKFTKRVAKVNGKIYLIERIFKDGSGVDYEKRMCENCGLRYKGARLKIGYVESITFNCPKCDS